MNKIVWGVASILLMALVLLFVPAVQEYVFAIVTGIAKLNEDLFGNMPAWFGYMIF